MASVFDRLSFMWGPAAPSQKGFTYASKPLTDNGAVPFARNSDKWVLGKSGLLEKCGAGEIAHEWDANGNFIGSSIEPSSTNLITDPLMTTSWGGASYTKEVTTLLGVAASKITVNTEGSSSGNSVGRFANNSPGFTHTSGVLCNLSFICKKESSSPFINIIIFFNGTSTSARFGFNVDTKTSEIVSNTEGVTNFLGSVVEITPNVFRCAASFTPNSTGTSGIIGVYLPPTIGGQSTGPVGTSFTVTAFNNGLGAVITSPILATTTRQADVCSKTGVADLIGQNEGTIWVEFNTRQYTFGNNYLIELYTDANNSIFVRKESGVNTYTMRMRSGGSNIWTYSGNTIAAGDHQLAIRYKNGDNKIFLDGAEVFAFASTGAVPTMSGIAIGRSGISANSEFNDHISFVGLSKEALTDTEIQNLPRITK